MARHLKRIDLFDRFADGANRVFGGSVAFVAAAGAVLLWAAMGPVFGFGEKWQLTINTGTTIVTFLMVFLIQHSQNKQTEAMHLKLNELLASHHEASNHLISVEDLSEEELQTLHRQQGWPQPAEPFVDMHDWGDRLVGAGFAEPVMDMERIVLSYSDPTALLDELRTLGRNRHPQRFGALRSRAWGRRYRDALAQGLPRDADGRLLLTFEVVYGHAFKPRPRVKPGEASAISLVDMRSMLRTPRAGRRGDS